VSDDKLVDLLDLALSADTVNTVKTLRDITETGVEPLALMSQLATIITDMLAGSYTFTRERQRRKFFKCPTCKHESLSRYIFQSLYFLTLKVLRPCNLLLLIFGSFFLLPFVKFFSLSLFCFFDLVFSFFFSFFICFFYRPFSLLFRFCFVSFFLLMWFHL
jgi:hypothetical protein